MKVSRSFVPVVKVEITFPCSAEEFMKVKQLHHKVSSLEDVDSVLSEYGIYPDNVVQNQPNVKVSRTIEKTSQKEEQVLMDLREKKSETPVLDAMAAAGLGSINMSEIVRNYVKNNPGKTRSEILAELSEKYVGRVCRSQFSGALDSQLYQNKLVSVGKIRSRRIYLHGQEQLQ